MCSCRHIIYEIIAEDFFGGISNKGKYDVGLRRVTPLPDSTLTLHLYKNYHTNTSSFDVPSGRRSRQLWPLRGITSLCCTFVYTS